MRDALRGFIRGFGSVIDLFSEPDFQKYVSETPEEQMRISFEQAGDSLRVAFEQYEREHGEGKKPKEGQRPSTIHCW